MNNLDHNALRSGLNASQFLWMTGIEDTFIAGQDQKTGRILDEYLLTEHYDRWEEDLKLVAELGVDAIRYGVPWYRICPRRGVFDWSWCDKVIGTLVERHKIEPIIDLIHYGTPQWLERSFLNPDYPSIVAEYAQAFAEHFKGRCFWYTPCNEPRVNAWYCGRLGWWPPYGRSWRWFTRILVQIVKGICLSQRAISSVEPRASFLHVDASDYYVPHREDDPALIGEARFRQELVFLALDLAFGKVSDRHPLAEWLGRHGVAGKDFDWFRQYAVSPDLIGFNMYPMYSMKEIARKKNGHITVRIRKTWTDTLVRLGRMYAERYRPVPLIVGETAYMGSMSRRIKWVEQSTSAILAEREFGIPYVGYTFWPLISLVGWAYQRGKLDFDRYLLHMGLFDLVKTEQGLDRKRTPVAESFKRIIRNERLAAQAHGQRRAAG